MSYESTISKLQEELNLKNLETQNLIQERKLLVTKKTKLKSLLKQRDQFISELKLQNEEAEKIDQGDVLQA